MNLTIKKAGTVLGAALCLAGCASPAPQTPKNPQDTMEEKLNLTDQWDKVFPQSDRVNHTKVTFHNRYGITLAADLYMPKDAQGKKLPAIAVSGPFGAVKE